MEKAHGRNSGKAKVMHPMEYERSPISELIGALDNEEDVAFEDALNQSIEQAGPLPPIIVNAINGQIVDGWHLYNALKKHGHDPAPYIRHIEFSDEHEERSFALLRQNARRNLSFHAKILIHEKTARHLGVTLTAKQIADEIGCSVRTVEETRAQNIELRTHSSSTNGRETTYNVEQNVAVENTDAQEIGDGIPPIDQTQPPSENPAFAEPADELMVAWWAFADQIKKAKAKRRELFLETTFVPESRSIIATAAPPRLKFIIDAGMRTLEKLKRDQARNPSTLLACKWAALALRAGLVKEDEVA
jgi:hypothetical protein